MGRDVKIRPRGNYNIVYSTSANRSSPNSLDGAQVSGSVYIFVSPTTNVTSVTWHKTPTAAYRTTSTSPFDLEGVSGADALPLNASLLSGPQQYWAVVTTANGNSHTLTASFDAASSPTTETVDTVVSVGAPVVAASSSVVIPSAVAAPVVVSTPVVSTGGGGAVLTADQNSTARTRSALALITANVGGSTNRIMSGEHIGGSSWGTLTNWNGINTKTGHYPAIMGYDYDGRSTFSSSINYTTANNNMKAHAAAGGLVTISIHAVNPQTNGAVGDMTCDIANLITPGHAVYNNWRVILDQYAVGLLDLQASNISVLWRPFHEMNNSSFWWTYRNTTMTVARYRTLWQQTFDYLVNVKGCHNLLWCYSSHVGDPAGLGRAAWYAGDAYTDIVGVSNYKGATITQTDKNNLLAMHNTIPQKPFAMMEVGKNSAETVFNATSWLSQIVNDFPYAVYWMNWSTAGHTMNGASQASVSALINDTIVRNRDEVGL